MKLVEFAYKKADGTVSERAVIEMIKPSTHFEGLDVSGLDEDAFSQFVSNYRDLKNRQQQEFQALLAQHDLTHNYRRFTPANMTNVVSEHI
jgi:hypothetical protein